ncbi:MAG: outer membrane protein assembly factor BamA [Kiritimatiellia bacterium]
MKQFIPIMALVLFFIASGLSAQSGNAVIGNIRVKTLGKGRVDETFVLAHIRSRPDIRLDTNLVSRDIKALLDTGLFSNVTVKKEESAGRADLLYEVYPRLRLVSPPEINGADHLEEDEVLDILELEAGDPVDERVLGTRFRKVAEKYREQYYPEVSATWEIKPLDKGEGLANATLNIQEGRRANVIAVRFEGNTSIFSGTLETAVGRLPWWKPAGWCARREYDPARLARGRTAVLAEYRDRGYLDVEVDLMPPNIAEHGDLEITYRINEGTFYSIGGFRMKGNELFPDRELLETVRLSPGDAASVNDIRRSARLLEDYYGRRGYLGTSVRARVNPDRETGRVNVVFAVTEGVLTRISDVVIRGNRRTRDKVIRRELTVYPGEIYDQVEIRRNERVISNIGYFDWVRSYPGETGWKDRKDVVFEVEEKPTGNFMMGFGYSSENNMSGYVEISQGNFDLTGYPYFTGAGQKIRLRAQYGSRQKLYEFSFKEPWLFDRRLSSTLNLYNSDVDYDYYDVERRGGGLSLGAALFGNLRSTLGYTLERISGIDDTNRYVFAKLPGEDSDSIYREGATAYFHEGKSRRSSVDLSFNHDTRNSTIFPSDGGKISLFVHVSDGILGSDTDIYGLGLSGVRYLPLWYGHVLKLEAKYEMVEEYGDTVEVPYSERLFIGGGRTLRGFEYRDVGPKVIPADSTGRYRPYGGRSLALASAEYAVPLVPGIRLAGFYDTGNVWPEPYDLNPDEMASSWGLGLRFDIPHFPVRIDRAWVINKDSELTDEEPWVFWLTYE